MKYLFLVLLFAVRLNAAAPVASYGFDEGVGTTTGLAGTLSGTTWAAGEFGKALSFSGVARVTVPDAAPLHLTAFTLSAWINPSAVNGWQDVIYKGPDSYYLDLSAGKPAVGGTWANGPLFAPAVLPLNAWSHLAATYDGATMRLYVNGLQVASRAQTGTPAVSTNPVQIGGDSLYGQSFTGLIDEVRIYNVALTAAQIVMDMNTAIGVVVQPPPPPPPVPAVLVWDAPSGKDVAGGPEVEVEAQIGVWPAGSNPNTSCPINRITGINPAAMTLLLAQVQAGLVAGTNYDARMAYRDQAGNWGPWSKAAPLKP